MKPAPIAAVAAQEEDCDKGDVERPRHPPVEEEAVKERERHAKCGKERSHVGLWPFVNAVTG